MDNHWSGSSNTSTDYGSGPFFLESPNRDRNPEALLAFVEQFCGENEMLVQANSSILTIPRGNSCFIRDSALLPRSLGSRSVSSTTLASETVVPGIDDEAAVQPTQLNSLENVHFDSQMNHQTVPIAMFNSLLTSQKSVLRELTCLREDVEEKTSATASYIMDLESGIRELSLELRHTKETALETAALYRDMKRLETMALEFVPLNRQEIVKEVEDCKEKIQEMRKREKQRRKKQELMKMKHKTRRAAEI